MRLLETEESVTSGLHTDDASLLDNAMADSSVTRYCREHDLDSAVGRAVALIREYFPNDTTHWSLQTDPESVGEWLEVLITTRQRPRDVGERFESLLRTFNQDTPFPQKGKLRYAFAFGS